ncbi:MAG: uracil-DNA glycosylase [Acidobacteriota bacterium]
MSWAASPKEQLRARLLELAEQGLDGWPAEGPSRPGRKRSRAVEAPAAEAEPAGRLARPAPSKPAAPKAPAAPAASPARRPLGQEDDSVWAEFGLQELGSYLRDCTRCKLAQGRKQVVYGVGDPKARLMFVGEGPGRDEDLQGEPFVGKAGQLLTAMIEKGMGLQRSDVYIANVVKCRPPNNRDPETDEVEACERFLKRQVALVEPEVIVCLGRFAVQCLLRTKTPISRLRGKWQQYEGTPLMPTFHPAYLLRNPGGKRPAWEDLQAVMAKLGLERPGRG